MSIIKVIDGEKRVVANVSITDHSQLTGREAYGAHPISAIRKLPEKLYELKEACQVLDGKIAAHDSEVDTQLQELSTQIQSKIDEVNALIESNKELIETALSNATAEADARLDVLEEGVQKVSLTEDPNNKGKLTFTNYNGEAINVQGGFLPNEDTITLVNDEMALKQVHTDETISGKGTSEDPLSAVAISDGTTKYTPGDLKTSFNNINTKLVAIDTQNENQNNKIYTLETITNGIGGYLNSYDFGANPTQEALTAYALQDIGVENQSQIFNGTKVINLHDNHIWMLSNTPDTTPAVFSWQDLGEQPIVSIATDTTYGVVKSSYEELQGNIDVNGTITINNLDLKLENINSSISDLETTVNDTMATELQNLKDELEASMPKVKVYVEE